MLKLEFKPDFENARSRWDALWNGTNTRPIVRITAPKNGIEPVDAPRYLEGVAEQQYDAVIDKVLRWAQTHDFLGDAIPFFQVELGANTFAGFLGIDMKFTGDTAWSVPVVEDWDDFEIKFRRDSVAWRQTVAFAQKLRARCDGKLLIAAPTLVANLDALEAMRGADKLLLDLIDQPEKVQRALSAVRVAYAEILEALGELLDFKTYGSITRHGFYHRGKINVPQCDFSCMIGPEMFREFVVPSLQHEMSLLDAVEYHLDGPGALKHLEALCEIEKLGIIQWVPGAGGGELKDWSELYRRIDALGKGNFLGGDLNRIKTIWNEFSSRRQVFNANCKTRREADELLQALENL